MAQDIFLKIDGIKGESQDSTHKDEIDVLKWRWEVFQESSMHSGSGGGSGKATVSDLTIEHRIDCASPNLMKFALTGRHIPQVMLVARKAGGAPHEYLKITMTDAIITYVRVSCGMNDDAQGLEIVSFSFSKFRKEYFVQNAQGGNGGTITASFDIRANTEV